MNKNQLIDEIVLRSGLTKIDSKKALEAFLEVTTEVLQKNDRLALIGFGSFGLSKRKARTGRNPKTGLPISIQAKNVVRFKAGSDLNTVL